MPVFQFCTRSFKMTLVKFMFISTLLTTYVIVYCSIPKPGPLYPPTKGCVWPKPQKQIKSDVISTVNVGDFTFLLSDSSYTCNILIEAISRYEKLLHSMKKSPEKPEGPTIHKNIHSQATVALLKPCKNYEMPYFGMDEKYQLLVADDINITSHSVWGIMRGMESLVQLIYTKQQGLKQFYINHTTISDWPAYPHRGLLIDTSRHYISLSNILKTLEAMEMNKMNVLHWHIVDDPSFPYQSQVFPELSAMGAFHESMVYSKHNIQEVIGFARDRGIRVIPEIDIPGHTLSWGQAFPNILTQCYKYNTIVSLGPLNPINTETYKLLRELFAEVQEWFPDKYFHIGGDEVDMDCWASNPELVEFMNKNNMTSVSQFQSLIMSRAIPLLKNDSIPIVWQDIFMQAPLKKETLVQVWRYYPIPTMVQILERGYQVLFSSDWYLDYFLDDWTHFYMVDPRSLIKNKTLAKGVVGGEACMWGEKVDDRNFISRVWPRASAVAERLWSGVAPGENWSSSWSQEGGIKLNQLQLKQMELVRHRLEEHTCRMIKRGINAEPASGSGFCLV